MSANPLYDQMDAAARDAAERLKAVATGGSDTYELANHGRVSETIVQRWFELGGDHSTQSMCEHVANSPQVVFGAAAFPGVAACHDCFQALWKAWTSMMLATNKGRPCDGCGQWAEEGKSGILNVGPMLMTVSMCRLCAALEDATERTK